MKKNIILSFIALVAVVAGVAGMAAFEAHVINVTAHIENALKVVPAGGELTFGTVFPQEYTPPAMAPTFAPYLSPFLCWFFTLIVTSIYG